MRKLLILLLFISSIEVNKAFSASDLLKHYTESKWKISKTQKTYLMNHKILSEAKVLKTKTKTNDDDDEHTFTLKAMALHSRNCKKVIRKLSLLEEYANWIDFIKKSDYDENSKLFTLRADHPLLPFPMLIHILVDRPTKEGRYPFSFPTGIFTGLTGSFEIIEINKQCFFYGESFWQGKLTRIPAFVIEIFSETLSKIGGEVLMRKSQ